MLSNNPLVPNQDYGNFSNNDLAHATAGKIPVDPESFEDINIWIETGAE